MCISDILLYAIVIRWRGVNICDTLQCSVGGVSTVYNSGNYIMHSTYRVEWLLLFQKTYSVAAGYAMVSISIIWFILAYLRIGINISYMKLEYAFRRTYKQRWA